jgi:hypothetical protein
MFAVDLDSTASTDQISSRTLVTGKFSFLAHGFFLASIQKLHMRFVQWITSRKAARSSEIFALRVFRRKLLSALVLALWSATVSFADASALLSRSVPAGCYCRCMQSHGRGGCTKICYTSKRASRWRANTCTKPRINHPSENPGAGPRYRRSDRAERASR